MSEMKTNGGKSLDSFTNKGKPLDSFANGGKPLDSFTNDGENLENIDEGLKSLQNDIETNKNTISKGEKNYEIKKDFFRNTKIEGIDEQNTDYSKKDLFLAEIKGIYSNEEDNYKNAILSNKSFQILYLNVLSDFEKQYNYRNENNEITDENKDENIKTILENEGFEDEDIGQSEEDYVKENATPENFKKFLLGDGLNYLKYHVSQRIDLEHNKLYTNISGDILKGDLYIAFIKFLRQKYKETNGFGEKIDDFDKTLILKNFIDAQAVKIIKFGNINNKEGNRNTINGIIYEFEEKGYNKEEKHDLEKDLEHMIKKYDEYVDKNPNNEEIRLRRDLYLMAYCHLFFKDQLNNKAYSESEKIYTQILQLIKDPNTTNVQSDYLRQEWLKLKGEADKRELERRRAIAERNRRRRTGHQNLDIKIDNHEHHSSKNIDISEASGVEIAEKENLGKTFVENLNENNNVDIKINQNKDKCFNEVRKRLSKEKHIDSLIDKAEFKSFIDLDNKKINEENFIKYKMLKHSGNQMDVEAREKTLQMVREILDKDFFKLFNEELDRETERLKKTESMLTEGNHHMQYEAGNHAIGSVIDNIKSIFNNLSLELNLNGYFDGLQLTSVSFDENNKKNLLINGEFNSSPVYIKYNANTGEIFMNSFIKSNGNEMIVNDKEANVYVGKIAPFNKIYEDYNSINKNVHDKVKEHLNDKINHKGIKSRNNVQHSLIELDHERESEMSRELELMSEVVKVEVKNKTVLNSAISKLLKTYNILDNNMAKSNLRFTIKDGDNFSMYNVLNILKETESDKKTLIKFEESMEKIFNEYVGIQRGRNNDKQNKKLNEKTKTIYESDSKKNTINSLKECTKNFDSEINGDINGKIGILELIISNFSTAGKLDKYKIGMFMDELEEDVYFHNKFSDME